MPSYQPGSDTRNRLLEAAAEVFSEQGFRHARVSDICRRAQANIAAVNYHFGDKEQLYVAVVRRLNEESQADAAFLRVDPNVQPEERLRVFVRELLYLLLKSGRASHLGKLMARETIEPTSALDFMVDNAIRPINSALREIVGGVLGLTAGHETVGLCVASILSQCITYHNSKEIVLRMDPHLMNSDCTFSAAAIDRLAEHVTRFSLQGMNGMAAAEIAVSGAPDGK